LLSETLILIYSYSPLVVVTVTSQHKTVGGTYLHFDAYPFRMRVSKHEILSRITYILHKEHYNNEYVGLQRANKPT